MSESEPDHTHRVVYAAHTRTNEAARKSVYEVGDPITPTEAELAAFPDRFEPIDDGAVEDAEATDATDDAQGEDSEAEAEDTDEDADTESADEGGLTRAAVEDADYNTLRKMAREFDDVNGNWGQDRLRAELLERVEA